MVDTYDRWLQNYDGWLESQEPLDRSHYSIQDDVEDGVQYFYVFENHTFQDKFNSYEDAESYIDYLLGV